MAAACKSLKVLLLPYPFILVFVNQPGKELAKLNQLSRGMLWSPLLQELVSDLRFLLHNLKSLQDDSSFQVLPIKDGFELAI